MKIPLTAGQIVTIHGWMTPKETLSWTDVLYNERLTFSFLHCQACISKELLHRLQPDITAWVSAKRVGLQDAPMLTLWGAHPIRDLKADLGDLINLGWRAAAMQKAGVTYADLVEAGMTPASMMLFGYTLYDWSTLGFTEPDASGLTAPELGRLFGLTRADVSRCFIGGRGGPALSAPPMYAWTTTETASKS
jgi:hypothetical protein